MALDTLLHLNGADNSTVITNSGSDGSTWACFGVGKLATEQQKFGTASLECSLDGSGDDYIKSLNVPGPPSTGGWTIDCWARLDTLGASDTAFWGWWKPGVNAGLRLYWDISTSNRLKLYIGDNALTASQVGTTALSEDVWFHLAVTRDTVAGKYYVYLNGVKEFEIGSAIELTTADYTDFYVGAFNGGQGVNGWVDEVRITAGCKYPSGTTFTPETTEYAGTLTFETTMTGGVVVGETFPTGQFAMTASGGVVIGETFPAEFVKANEYTMSGGVVIGTTFPVSLEPASYADSIAFDGLSVLLDVDGGTYHSGEVEFIGMLSVTGELQAGVYAEVDIELNGLSVAAFEAMKFELSLEGMSVDIEVLPGAAVEGDIVLSGMSVSGSVSGEILYDGSLSIDLLHVEVTLISETLGEIDVVLPSLHVVATGYAGRVGDIELTLEGLTVSAEGWPDAEIAGQLTFTGLSVQGIIEEVLSAVFNTLCMSVELGGESVTEFNGYNFNAYANFNGLHVGSGPNGLYELDNGDDDQGSPIVAAFLGGITDFDSEVQVQVPYAYITARTDGQLAIVTRTNETTERKHAIQDDGDSSLHRRRVQLDNSPKSLEWQFGVENIEGSDFAVSHLSILPVRTDRRI